MNVVSAVGRVSFGFMLNTSPSSIGAFKAAIVGVCRTAFVAVQRDCWLPAIGRMSIEQRLLVTEVLQSAEEPLVQLVLRLKLPMFET